MKKVLYITGVVLLLSVALASGQGMMGGGMMGGVQVTAEEINHTWQEEAEGFEIWTKLQNKEVSCNSLTDEQYELLGEYFMGQSAGDYHAAMNKRMQQMMGEAGEEQMHISLGRQYSGCATASNTGYYGMMGRGASQGNNVWGPGMMFGYGFWSPWSLLWIAFWILALTALVLAVVWLYRKITSRQAWVTPVEILKARYAKGELTKKQFEEMKKELS